MAVKPASLSNLRSFKPGESGNLAGRTNPAKRAAGESCWKALLEDFTKHGVKAIVKMRATKPEQYVALVASGLPAEKAIDLNVRTAESLNEQQARMMAEEYLASCVAVGAQGADPVHAGVPARLPSRTTTPKDR